MPVGCSSRIQGQVEAWRRPRSAGACDPRSRRCEPWRTARPGLPPVAGHAARRVRRRRCLLRDLGLPDHCPSPARGPRHQPRVAPGVLGAARTADPARVARRPARLHDRYDRVRPAAPLGDVPGGDPSERALRAELASGRHGRRLSRRGRRAHPRPALLVAVRGGAVLSRVAGPHPGRSRDRAPGHRHRAVDGHAAQPRVLGAQDGHRSGGGLLRHPDAGVGVRRRRAARSRGADAVRAQPARVTITWVGPAAIAVAAVAYSPSTPFPGAAALLPILGTLAVIRAAAPTAALSWRPLQFLGDIS